MSFNYPVKYPVKHYSHSDTGAPQITNADGVIKNILKACLVTGYGSKDGAGWTQRFEDANRIVLRRPLSIGNPPDLKIENGIIDGAARHRVVTQDNPPNINHNVNLTAVNLMARDTDHGLVWHLIASDFAFILCYQVGYSGIRNHILFAGGCQNLSDADTNAFFVSKFVSVQLNGTVSGGLRGMFEVDCSFVNGSNALAYRPIAPLTIPRDERYINNEYLSQSIYIDYNYVLPFFCSAATQTTDYTATIISESDRPMLRYFNANHGTTVTDGARALYIPLDYWEL